MAYAGWTGDGPTAWGGACRPSAPADPGVHAAALEVPIHFDMKDGSVRGAASLLDTVVLEPDLG